MRKARSSLEATFGKVSIRQGKDEALEDDEEVDDRA